MGDISQIKLLDDNTYTIKDTLAVSNATFAGHELTLTKRGNALLTIDLGEFDTLQVTDLNVGNLIATGAARFTNGIYGNLTGNADTATTATSAGSATTATKFAEAKAVTLTGDTTGTASSQAGWSIATTTKKLTSLGRLTSANVDNSTAEYLNKISYFLASSSMTEGKPPSDSHILNFAWDNGKWSAQLAIKDGATPHIYIRGNNNSVWDANWLTVLDSNNYTSYTVSKTGSGASGNWNINAATATNFSSDRAITLSGDVTGSASSNGSNGWSITTSVANDSHNHTTSTIVPLATKTYTGLIGTSSNNAANDSFYFMKCRPSDWYKQWKIRYRVTCYVPNKTNFYATSDVIMWGYGQAIAPAYSIFNTIYSTNHRPYYYHNIQRLSQTGYNANLSNAIGIGLRASHERATSGYERTMIIEVLETYNCTFELLDTAVKWENWTNGTTTNYAGLSEFDGCNNGLRETGEDNDTTTLQYSTSRLTAGSNGMPAYSIVMMKPDGTWEGLTVGNATVATTSTKNSSGFVLGQMYLFWSGSNIAANNLTGTGTIRTTQDWVDLRYTLNCGTTLTANKTVYLKGKVINNLFYLDDTWWTQTVPTTNDGFVYIPIGMCYGNGYSACFWGYHGAYFHNGTSFVAYYQDKDTWTAFVGASASSNGTAGYISAPGAGNQNKFFRGDGQWADPIITNNVTGSGTSGYLAKFNGTNTITNGPQLGSATNTYLRNDGTWATPPNDNTTYDAATANPLMDGTVAVGTSAKYAREDHRHPSDTSKVDVVAGKQLSTEDYTTAEKTKLSGIATGAEVNQNAFSNVTVGSTTIAADSKTDTLTLTAGSNITLTPDATNDKITIASSYTNTIPSAICSTVAATAAKTASCTSYALMTSSYIQVIMENSNTAASALTLSINGKTAKTIKINDAVSSSSNYTLPAGSYIVYYDGTNYCFRTDGRIPGFIQSAYNVYTSSYTDSAELYVTGCTQSTDAYKRIYHSPYITMKQYALMIKDHSDTTEGVILDSYDTSSVTNSSTNVTTYTNGGRIILYNNVYTSSNSTPSRNAGIILSGQVNSIWLKVPGSTTNAIVLEGDTQRIKIGSDAIIKTVDANYTFNPNGYSLVGGSELADTSETISGPSLQITAPWVKISEYAQMDNLEVTGVLSATSLRATDPYFSKLYMGGTITFRANATNAISYAGTNGTYHMIRFINNTLDGNGQGIAIGGGGSTIIGGGESAAVIVNDTTNWSTASGEERMVVANDAGIDFLTNVQNGTASAKSFMMDANGNFFVKGGGHLYVGNGKTGSYTTQGTFMGANGNMALTGGSGNPGGGIFFAYNGASSSTAYIRELSSGTIEIANHLQCTGLVYSIGAGEHYCEARNTTTGMRTLLDSNAGGWAGVWVNGHYSSSGGLISAPNWLIYQGNTSGTSDSTVWLDSAKKGVIAHGNLHAYGNMGCLGSGAHWVKAINTDRGYGVYLYAAADVHGVWSDGYSSTSSPQWGLYRTTTGEWKIRSYVSDATPVGSIAADKQRVSYLGCNGAAQAAMYAQWMVAGSTYKFMYWSVSSSDIRLKENIVPCTENAVEMLKKLPVYSFDWKADKKHWKMGFIAQEVYEIEPELCIKPDDEEEGYWGMNDHYFIAVHTKAIQELSAENENLKKEISQLKNTLNDMAEKLKKLEV